MVQYLCGLVRVKPCSHQASAATSPLTLRKGLAVFPMGTFRQVDVDVDNGKWILDSFEVSKLASTLTQPLLGVDKPLNLDSASSKNFQKFLWS